MIQTMIFDCENEIDLTNEVNDFLKRLPDSAVLDIKFACSHFVIQNGEQIYAYSAMVIYKNMLK